MSLVGTAGRLDASVSSRPLPCDFEKVSGQLLSNFIPLSGVELIDLLLLLLDIVSCHISQSNFYHSTGAKKFCEGNYIILSWQVCASSLTSDLLHLAGSSKSFHLQAGSLRISQSAHDRGSFFFFCWLWLNAQLSFFYWGDNLSGLYKGVLGPHQENENRRFQEYGRDIREESHNITRIDLIWSFISSSFWIQSLIDWFFWETLKLLWVKQAQNKQFLLHTKEADPSRCVWHQAIRGRLEPKELVLVMLRLYSFSFKWPSCLLTASVSCDDFVNRYWSNK